MSSTDLPPHEKRFHFPFTASTKAGAAQRTINPPTGIRAASWGAAKSHVATGIHRDITTTALAFINERAIPLYLVTVDWGWWQGVNDDWAIRGKVIEALGIDADQLQLHLTHTHAGPNTASDVADLEGGELVAPYHQFAIDSIVEACKQARDEAGDAKITWAYGKCDLAVNRELPCGEVDIVGFNPGVDADDTLTVGRICDSAGKIIATIVNYACHPTTLAWQNTDISPDFVGAARELVELKTGAPMLFLQGASGDLAPRDGYVGDHEIADKNGRILGFASLAILEKMIPSGKAMRFARRVESGALLAEWEEFDIEGSTAFNALKIEVDVPLQDLPTFEELEERWKDIDEGARNTRLARARKLRTGYVLEGQRAKHPVWIWSIGDAVIVGQPGEAYSYLQMELRRRHPDRVIFVLNCTNGPGYMYIPTPDAYQRFRYQSWQTLLAEGALELITDEVSAVISRLPKNIRE
jgi:hypothetical protein